MPVNKIIIFRSVSGFTDHELNIIRQAYDQAIKFMEIHPAFSVFFQCLLHSVKNFEEIILSSAPVWIYLPGKFSD